MKLTYGLICPVCGIGMPRLHVRIKEGFIHFICERCEKETFKAPLYSLQESEKPADE